MASGMPKVNTAFTWAFKMVDATDFATPETGLTVTVQIRKAGGSFAGLTGSPSITEIANGWYEVVVPAADMNTTHVILKATATGAAQSDEAFYLDDQITSDVYARLGAPAGASIAADVAGVQSDTNDIQTRLPAALVSGKMDSHTATMADDVITATKIATDALGSLELAASAVSEIAAAIPTAPSIANEVANVMATDKRTVNRVTGEHKTFVGNSATVRGTLVDTEIDDNTQGLIPG